MSSHYNTTAGVGAYADFTFQQDQGSLSGSCIVYPPLIGSGPLIGTITHSGYVKFTVQDNTNNLTLYYQGNIRSGSLQGAYTTSNGQQGIWSIP